MKNVPKFIKKPINDKDDTMISKRTDPKYQKLYYDKKKNQWFDSRVDYDDELKYYFEEFALN